jgi:hypothetical protein
MRRARRFIYAGFTVTAVPALVLFALTESGIRVGGHDAATVIALRALEVCMAVSALLLVIGLSRATASILSSPVARDPLNLATSAIGAVSLATIVWFGWRIFGG